jgi:PadR family transcriptional regulator PadR
MDTTWLAQARRGVVELCVLVLIQQQPRYGYDLAVTLARWEPLATSEGTLYPLLRRLQREQLVETFWQESQDGPPRKYYKLTPAGAKLLEVQLADWRSLTQAVADLRQDSTTSDQSDDSDGGSDGRHSNEDKEVPDGSGSQRQPALPGRAARQPEPAART